MKLIMFFVFVMFFEIGVCQTKQDKDELCDQLNWNSFCITTNHFPRLILNKSLTNLLERKEKNSFPYLIQCIHKKDKTVAIHILLTNVFEVDKNALSISYVYGKDSSIQIIKYTYNSLSWFYSIKKDSFYVNRENIKNIYKYWKSYIKRKKGNMTM
jgi:hypothetical protein